MTTKTARLTTESAKAATSRADKLDMEAIIARLCELTDMADRLGPCHRNPHKFHEDKSDLVKGLDAVRRQLEGR